MRNNLPADIGEVFSPLQYWFLLSNQREKVFGGSGVKTLYCAFMWHSSSLVSLTKLGMLNFGQEAMIVN